MRFATLSSTLQPELGIQRDHIMKIISIRSPRLLTVALAFAALAACAKGPVENLPKLDIDPARVVVAGLSSGAYMATQSHLAWPEIFSGAALVAGGPYGCAQGDLGRALSSCTKGKPANDVEGLVNVARQRSTQGKLGELSALAGDHIYVLHGRQDNTVAESVSRDSADFYTALKKGMPALDSLSVQWDGERDFAHNLPLVTEGKNCDKSESPYLGHCGFDAAGAIYSYLYGKATNSADTAKGELRPFSQKALNGDLSDTYLADNGYVYLPAVCLAGERCGVLVVFHGCQQNADTVGETFVREAGFNRWADVYKVAVLYPQTRATFAPLNPKACWDWWGYSGEDYDTRQGVQQQWLMHALAALGVPQAAR